jgi:hypothetical protein
MGSWNLGRRKKNKEMKLLLFFLVFHCFVVFCRLNAAIALSRGYFDGEGVLSGFASDCSGFVCRCYLDSHLSHLENKMQDAIGVVKKTLVTRYGCNVLKKRLLKDTSLVEAFDE